VPEGGRVHVAQLRDGELGRRQCEAGVRVRQLRAQPLAAREHDRLVVEGEHGKTVDRMPRGIARDARVGVARNESEVSRRKLPLLRSAVRFAPCLELFEMRDLAYVDLDRKVTADRRLEGLAGDEVAAGEGPTPLERLLRALPEQDLKDAEADL